MDRDVNARSTESSGPASVGVSDLTFSYEEGKEVLKGLDLEIGAGERFGIIGPSGAGKSTLLLHLNGILSPAAGSISIGGLPVEKENLALVRQKVGIVFQNPDDQLFNPTVEEDVAFGPLNMGLGAGEVARRVGESLRSMKLEGFETLSSHHISYGERKRVALATVLAMKPDVVAFDEPFSNLNPEMVEQLIDIMRGLPATVIIVSQSILPVLASCDRLAVLNDGKIEAVGVTRDIAADRELLRRCGVDFHFYCEVCSELLGVSDD